jgi:hypothetical protein
MTDSHSAMNTASIEALLASRHAWLKGDSGNMEEALSRAEVTRFISNNYPLFEQVRDRIFRATDAFMRHVEILPETLSPEGHLLVQKLLKHKLVIHHDKQGHDICEATGKRYLSGGWLEELAWLAARDAGADEAFYGQVIGWSVKGFTGENEIDLIMRKGATLGFVSCKALRSGFDNTDKKHRNRLMDAVHEADNLLDHFGKPGERVAVLVSTDLFDELKGQPRYMALAGKAAILDVRIISLEDMGFDRLVNALNSMWEERTS